LSSGRAAPSRTLPACRFVASVNTTWPDAARACWLAEPGRAELRSEPLARPGQGEVGIRTLHSGISRGTEGLVFRGEVPSSEHQRMRAPFQAGAFPAPVKYGYSSVGRVEIGPDDLVGRAVFCLHPHQDVYVVPAEAVTALPAGLPPSRALLAANLETAINALWDAAPQVGDRIAVVGAGVVGLLVAWLARQVPGCQVGVVDIDPQRRRLAEALGLQFASPETAAVPLGEADLVVHASGSAPGLATALGLAGFEATVLELSWYGTRPVAVPLGEAFHARRLRLQSSQVGAVAPSRRARRSHGQRLALALSLLADPALDGLISAPARFEDLPATLAQVAGAGGSSGVCQRIDYG
jgi:NADPH:quinone reductase-like Zn-dependent oxidoreductase